MNALVVGAAPQPGEEAFYRGLLARATLVLAADAAGEWCVGMGRTPEYAVGDFDSARPGAPDRLRALGVTVLTAPVAKDESDLDIAVRTAREAGATRLAVTAAFSARLDHTLAGLGTLASATDLLASAVEPDMSAWPVGGQRRQLALDIAPGTTVSVFALESGTRVTLEGFEFPLADAALHPLSSHGLSNVATGDRVLVRADTGSLVVLANVEPSVPRPRADDDWVY